MRRLLAVLASLGLACARAATPLASETAETVVVEIPSPLPAVSEPTEAVTPAVVAPTATAEALPAMEDSPAGSAQGAALSAFADFPGNLAQGEPAPDFEARVMGGAPFVLSAQDGYVLLIPTVVGCADCLFNMQEISTAYPDYRESNIAVVLLNLYPDDEPDSWQQYAELIPESAFLWAVVNSTDFFTDYNIQTLGTTLLISPEQRVVFRSEYPVFADGFRQVFDLALASQ
ncbi:MAG: hypothetical protein ACE5FI_11160 [Anaerolineales bacterium]